jgi:hypothetical protein
MRTTTIIRSPLLLKPNFLYRLEDREQVRFLTSRHNSFRLLDNAKRESLLVSGPRKERA